MRKILFGFSVVINLIFISLLILVSSQKTSSFSFLNMDSGDTRYITAAAVVSIPEDAEAVVGPLEITLRKGTQAAVQFSTIYQKRQLNRARTALYDHSVISVEPNGYGIVIKALEAGETSMQTVLETGIVDVAHIKVLE